MDAPDRGALMLVRFIAVALIGMARGGTRCCIGVHCPAQPRAGENSSRACLKSIPAVAGVVILIKAKAIAEWISNKLDE